MSKTHRPGRIRIDADIEAAEFIVAAVTMLAAFTDQAPRSFVTPALHGRGEDALEWVAELRGAIGIAGAGRDTSIEIG